jgi:hypothetical protein
MGMAKTFLSLIYTSLCMIETTVGIYEKSSPKHHLPSQPTGQGAARQNRKI